MIRSLLSRLQGAVSGVRVGSEDRRTQGRGEGWDKGEADTMTITIPCPSCAGTRIVAGRTCHKCRGAGAVVTRVRAS
jgi:DnaJ-class molecular chaperone